MFQRRVPKTRRQKLSQAVWPSMGLRRLMRYYKHRIIRLKGTPGQIAGGFAVGIAVSCTPFLGLHMLIGFLACLAFRLSKISMLIGTVLGGNPWTVPVISISSYELGHKILGHARESNAIVAKGFSLSELIDNPLDLLLPMTVGSIPLMIVFGILFFVLVKSFVTSARTRKGVAS